MAPGKPPESAHGLVTEKVRHGHGVTDLNIRDIFDAGNKITHLPCHEMILGNSFDLRYSHLFHLVFESNQLSARFVWNV